MTNLTDEMIESAFDNLGMGLMADEVVMTHETLDDFVEAARGYASHGAIERTEKTLVICDAQPRRGDVRRDVYVVDFGDVRGCYA